MRDNIAGVLVEGLGRNEICHGVVWDKYKSLVAMNPSTVAHGADSMKHLRQAWYAEDEDSPSKQWGRAVHTMLLEPQEFAGRYVQWEGRRQGKEYEKFAADCWESGKEVLKTEQFDSIAAAGESFLEECSRPGSEIKQLIAAGNAEVSLFAVEGNVQCRGRVDWLATSGVLLDVKTTRNIHQDKFWRDFYGYRYDLKLGLYQRWVRLLTGLHHPVLILAIENKPPYDIALVPIDDAVLELGMKKGLAIIGRLEECIRTGYWPGVAKGERYPLKTPAYRMDDDEETVEWEEGQ